MRATTSIRPAAAPTTQGCVTLHGCRCQRDRQLQHEVKRRVLAVRSTSTLCSCLNRCVRAAESARWPRVRPTIYRSLGLGKPSRSFDRPVPRFGCGSTQFRCGSDELYGEVQRDEGRLRSRAADRLTQKKDRGFTANRPRTGEPSRRAPGWHHRAADRVSPGLQSGGPLGLRWESSGWKRSCWCSS
jgi:hypothetical protein